MSLCCCFFDLIHPLLIRSITDRILNLLHGILRLVSSGNSLFNTLLGIIRHLVIHFSGFFSSIGRLCNSLLHCCNLFLCLLRCRFGILHGFCVTGFLGFFGLLFDLLEILFRIFNLALDFLGLSDLFGLAFYRNLSPGNFYRLFPYQCLPAVGLDQQLRFGERMEHQGKLISRDVRIGRCLGSWFVDDFLGSKDQGGGRQ